MTLRENLEKSLGWGIGLFVVCALGMSALWYLTPYTHVAGTGEDAMAIRPHAEGSVAYIKEHNTCKPTVEGIFPTGVIFQDGDDRAHFSKNPVHISKALDEEFADKDWKNHVVNYFCK